MEKSKKAKSAVPAFNFCNVLKTILTTAKKQDPGNTDYWGLAFAHRDEWNTLIKGVKAQPPKGFARSVNDGDQIYSLSGPSFGASEPAYEWSGTQDLHANLISADTMTWDNECVVCFGKGHPARCQKDGVVITCATL
jgi:hypothetical protein